MKIYIGHSQGFDFEHEIYQPIRASQLNAEHEIILPHEGFDGTRNFVTKDIIKTCNVIIAEVSFPATGLGIELGWADIFQRPIICIYRKNSKISGSLKAVCNNFVEYTGPDDLIKKLENTLRSLPG